MKISSESLLKLDKNDVLRPSIRTGDGQVKYTTNFRTGNDGIYVEVSLPPSAGRNDFRVAVARKKQPPIAEQSFTWNRTDSTREFFFALAKVAEAGGGKGDYEVRLYSGDSAAVTLAPARQTAATAPMAHSVRR